MHTQEKPTWEFVDFEPENLSLAVLKNKPITRSFTLISSSLNLFIATRTLHLANNFKGFSTHSILLMFPFGPDTVNHGRMKYKDTEP